jgi:hypothetical protein
MVDMAIYIVRKCMNHLKALSNNPLDIAPNDAPSVPSPQDERRNPPHVRGSSNLLPFC